MGVPTKPKANLTGATNATSSPEEQLRLAQAREANPFGMGAASELATRARGEEIEGDEEKRRRETAAQAVKEAERRKSGETFHTREPWQDVTDEDRAYAAELLRLRDAHPETAATHPAEWFGTLFGQNLSGAPPKAPSTGIGPEATQAPTPDATAPPPTPARPQAFGGGGGGGASAGTSQLTALQARIGKDYDERIAAMEREREGKAQQMGAEAGALEAASGEQRRMAEEGEDAAAARAHQAMGLIDEIHGLVRDYADGHIDQRRWWSDRTVPQRIAVVLGSMLSGFSGGPQAAQSYINSFIERDINDQKEALGRKQNAAFASQGLLRHMLDVHGELGKAESATRAAYLGAAIRDASVVSERAGEPVVRAQIDQLIADMRRQKETQEAAMVAQHARGGAGAGAVPAGFEGAIPLDNGAEVVPLPDGTQLYVGKGGEDVRRSVETSTRAVAEANELAALLDPNKAPSPLTSPGDYLAYISAVRQHAKNLSMLDAPHLGMGTRGSLGMFNNIVTALGGPEGNLGYTDIPRLAANMSTWQSQAMRTNTQSFAAAAAKDMAAIAHEHAGVVGRQVVLPSLDPRERARGVQRPYFIAGATPSSSQAAPTASPAAPYKPESKGAKPLQP